MVAFSTKQRKERSTTKKYIEQSLLEHDSCTYLFPFMYIAFFSLNFFFTFSTCVTQMVLRSFLAMVFRTSERWFRKWNFWLKMNSVVAKFDKLFRIFLCQSMEIIFLHKFSLYTHHLSEQIPCQLIKLFNRQPRRK